MMRILLILFLSIFSLGQLSGQDSHFSIFNYRHGGINPALTGYQQDNGELRSLYRTQWGVISPITSMSLEIEKQEDLWGYGINWNKTGAGPGSLISNQINLGASRQVDLNSDGILRLGLQLEYYQHALDWNGAIFESQAGPNGTTGVDNGEELTLAKSSSFDLNGGLFFSQKAGENTINIGTSLSHISQGKLSLYTTGRNSLKTKKMVQVGIDIPSVNDWTISPNFIHKSQLEASQSILAATAAKKVDAEKSISFGLGVRFKDALIFQTEFNLDNLSLALAYDANISKLKTASNGFGAFEIGFRFRFQPAKDYSETVNLRMTDSDNDGIADEYDHCPEVFGNIHNDGCPGSSDSDNDGIVDEVDLCPEIYGSHLHGGCPDSDGDGVADIDDECPTIYGAFNFQGCPDSDQDGISDKYDACPATFGSVENKGCPSNKLVQPTTNLGEYLVQDTQKPTSNPQTLPIYHPKTNHQHSYTGTDYLNSTPSQEETTDPLSIFKESDYTPPSPASEVMQEGEVLEQIIIFFDKNESMLDFLDKKRLRDFAATLPQDSNLKIVLKGHTDKQGSDLYNMELGYRRAESVKRYLSQFGLSEENILTLSYGEKCHLIFLQEKKQKLKTDV